MEKTFRSVLTPYAVPEGMSLAEFLNTYNPDLVNYDKVILEDLEAPNKKITYGGLRKQAAIGATALRHRYNLAPGDTAIIYSTNSVDYSLFAHSIMWMGCVIAGINIAWSGAELGNSISVVEPKIIAVEPHLKKRMLDGLQKAKGLKHIPAIVELGDNEGAVSPPLLKHDNLKFPRSFIDQPPAGLNPLPPFDLTGQDNRKQPCLILFSSGTTGNPKAVLLSHHNLIAHLSGVRLSDQWLNNCNNREIFFAPFAHMLGVLGAMIVPAFVGSYIGVMRQYTLPKYIRACAEAKATIMKVVPSVAVAFVQHPLVQELDLSSITYILTAGATLQPEVVQKLQSVFKGVHFVQGYGEIRIVDEDLKDVGVGKPGEVLVRGPTVFMGYKNNEKATKETFHNGWMRTGDVLSIDDDGFLWFHERRKEMIKVKGNQVAPSELEGIIGSHPQVIEAAVCGYWDSERQTEWPIGYAVLAPSVPVSERRQVLGEIQAWVSQNIAPYKRLRGGLHYIEALPKNPTGKLQRSQLPIKLVEKRRNKV
ncbi:hypothetical protein N7490_011751 [Penicillium lividum]|nr:hypothetical protein N7490_011751 [Penicillium lividum]